MAAAAFVSLFAIAALLALLGSACVESNADPADAAAVAASGAAAHRVAEADYYTDALSAFERADSANHNNDTRTLLCIGRDLFVYRA